MEDPDAMNTTMYDIGGDNVSMLEHEQDGTNHDHAITSCNSSISIPTTANGLGLGSSDIDNINSEKMDKTVAKVEVEVENENEVTNDSPTAAEERHIRAQRHETTANVTSKLESVLTRLRDVTSTMLGEMSVYLENAESVEIDYVKCQYSQRREARRLEGVAPDIHGTTSSLV